MLAFAILIGRDCGVGVQRPVLYEVGFGSLRLRSEQPRELRTAQRPNTSSETLPRIWAGMPKKPNRAAWPPGMEAS